MHPTIVTLCGSLAINSFGFCIVVGLIIFSILVLRDPRRSAILSSDAFFNALSFAILVALVGARALYVITHWPSMHSFLDIIGVWRGGFSLLGAFISCFIVMPLYLKRHHINTIALMDLVALYLPLLQAISRIGCFFAGCCFGIPVACTTLVHPTQLYSAFALFTIFLFLYFYAQQYCKKPLQMMTLYLVLMAVERFVVDFWRAEREMVSLSYAADLSVAQIIAASIAITAVIVYACFTFLIQRHTSYESL
jgi:phosphatidylglycerol---prolipoprotein diacylglyceryl transferase